MDMVPEQPLEPLILKPGVYEDIPFDDYVRIDAVNNSTLKQLHGKTPEHARHYQIYGRETQAFAFGRLTHVLLLEPDRFGSLYAVCEAKNDKSDEVRKGTNAWKEAEAQATEAGKELIKPSMLTEAQATVDAIKKQRLHRFITKGKAEVTLVWPDDEDVEICGEFFPATGLMLKCRVDYAHIERDILLDVKGLDDTSPDKFDYQADKLGYHRQAAMSAKGWETLRGRTPAFTFLVIEKCPGAVDPLTWPYPAFGKETQPNTFDAGEIEFRRDLRIWADCVARNEWPGWEKDVYPFELPDYRLKQIGIHSFNMW